MILRPEGRQLEGPDAEPTAAPTLLPGRCTPSGLHYERFNFMGVLKLEKQLEARRHFSEGLTGELLCC